MTTYTNPTGTLTATDGDDTIIFNAPPTAGSTIDAAGGNDSLLVQFDSAGPASFSVSDEYHAGFFDVQFSTSPFIPVYVLHVESIDLHGTANNDHFLLSVYPSSAGLPVSMNGEAGDDLLAVFAQSMTTGINFAANGSSITSNFGTFSNFETFDIRAGSGNDTITTGAGDDAVDTGTGVDHVSTGAGNDSIYIESTGGSFDAGDGNDWVSLAVGSSFSSFAVDGGAGQDQLNIGGASMTTSIDFEVNGSTITSNVGSFANFEKFQIFAGSGNDIITTAAADDYLVAGAGNDTVTAGDGNDTVWGQAGDDTINGNGGNDTLYGQEGNDTINGGDGVDTIYGDIIQSSLTGDGNDHLSGGAGSDTIYGAGGDDTIDGGADNDYLVGGKGSDHIDGGDGNDHIDGHGEYGYSPDDNLADVLNGGAGDDVITAGFGDTVDGGTGTDQLYYSAFSAPAGITVDFSTLTSGGTISIAGGTLSGIEYVIGISGTGYNDTIVAGAVPGVDGVSISGWGGDDNLTGSSGTDSIYGGDGNDVIHGGVGYNPSVYPSTDRLYGEAGNDTIYSGPDGALVSGGTGNDTIYGANAYDELVGDAGDDKIYGGGGNDGLQGWDGNDLLTGGAGTDTMSGGAGDDTFSDTAAGLNGDTINDFAAGDVIVITDANLSGFTFSLSGNVLNYTGGHVTLGSGVPGKIVATAAAGGGVQLSVQLPPLGTVDQIATQLASGYWNGDSHHFNVTQGGTITVNISTLNATEQTLARAALQEWTDIIGVNFHEVLTGGQILFDHSEDPSGPIAATDAVWSNGITSSAHVHISSSWVNLNGSTLNSYSFQTYVHEIGHALGLGHPGNYNDTGDYPFDASFLNDAWSTSVMSYFDQWDNTYFHDQGFTRNYALTPMIADIAAMQQLYGLSTTTRAGNSIYGYHSNVGGIYDANNYYGAVFTIFDAGGNDTLDYSGSYSGVTLNLNPETFSSANGTGNISIGRGVVIENAIGGSGWDKIIGNSANNVLTGGANADTLTGGAGNDTFKDTSSNLNGDTITDFSAGDKIIISDANLAAFSFNLSGNTLTFSGGSLTLGSVPSGTIVASAAEGGGVQLTVVQHDPANDFNGDGRSDILWRNDNGNMSDWLGASNGGFLDNAANAYDTVPTSWHVAGTGDFNGDGRDDILWRNDNGNMSDWLGASNGGFFDNAANAFTNVTTSWHVAAVGDFNGDGRDDILWRNDDGRMSDWLGASNGGFFDNAANAYDTVPTSWHVAGVGDFNGDGRDDILWRNDDGRMSDWLGASNGGFFDNAANAHTSVPTSWHIAGVGDFNGDGRDDILWRNDDGRMSDWLGASNGGFFDNAANAYTNVPTSWHMAGTGDFNGDGRDDILWRNDNGNMTDWLGASNGGFFDNAANAYTSVPTSWQVQAELIL